MEPDRQNNDIVEVWKLAEQCKARTENADISPRGCAGFGKKSRTKNQRVNKLSQVHPETFYLPLSSTHSFVLSIYVKKQQCMHHQIKTLSTHCIIVMRSSNAAKFVSSPISCMENELGLTVLDTLTNT